MGGGEDCGLFLTTEGKIYGFGRGDNGQFALGGSYTYYNDSVFEITSAGSSVLRIPDTLTDANHIIMQSGELYVTGSNTDGQLGIGVAQTTTAKIDTFTLIAASNLGNQTPIVVQGGQKELQVLVANGDIYGFGYNYYNQIARGSTDDVISPTLETSTFSGTPVQIVTGQWFSGVLTTSGNIYTVGDAGDGRLGNGDSSTDQTSHQLLSLNVGTVQDLETIKTPLNTTTYSIATVALSWISYDLGLEAEMQI